MVNPSALPNVAAAVVDSRGVMTQVLRDFLLSLANQATSESLRAELTALAARVADLENDTAGFTISGQQSVRVLGTPSSGVVQLMLQGDSGAPGATYYYGTNAAGTKGFYEHAFLTLSDAPSDYTGQAGMSVAVNATEDGLEFVVGGAGPITTEGDLIVGDAAGLPDRLPIGAPGEVLTSDGTTAAWAPSVGGGVGAISFNIGNGTNVILPGIKGNVPEMPYDCTIDRISLASRNGQVGSVVLDIWVTPLGSSPPTVADSICGAAKPTIVVNDTYTDATLTGWTVNLLEGDNVVFVVDSASSFNYLSGTIKVTKS